MLELAPSDAAVAAEPQAPSPGTSTIVTRFGPIPFDPTRIISLPAGLFGFAHRTRFILSEVKDRATPLKLLQSVEDPELGFLVLPLALDQGPIERRELQQAGTRAGISPESLVVLAIVTLRAAPGEVCCTVNLKAPILIDGERQLGSQQVLASDAYDVRHPLPLGLVDAA